MTWQGKFPWVKCYLQSSKKHVNLGFRKGNEDSDTANELIQLCFHYDIPEVALDTLIES